jgi:hypothetical protein
VENTHMSTMAVAYGHHFTTCTTKIENMWHNSSQIMIWKTMHPNPPFQEDMLREHDVLPTLWGTQMWVRTKNIGRIKS